MFPTHGKILTALTAVLLSTTALQSPADAGGRSNSSAQQSSFSRPAAQAIKPAVRTSATVEKRAEPRIVEKATVEKVGKSIERDPPKRTTFVERAPVQKVAKIVERDWQPKPAKFETKIEKIVTSKSVIASDPRVTMPKPVMTTVLVKTAPMHILPISKDSLKPGGIPPPFTTHVPAGGKAVEPGPKADGGNNNNNAGTGQQTGGKVGQGGTAIDHSDTNVNVGAGGTYVIGGASANGGNNNGNANGAGAQSSNGAGKGGKVVDDRDYKIDPSQGSIIVVKADTANGGNNNGNSSNGGQAGRNNGNGGKVVDDRDIVIKGGDKNNTIVIEKDQAVKGQDNGRGNGQAGKVVDKRDIKIEIDQGDKVIYGGKEIKAAAGDIVTIHNGHVRVEHPGH